MKKHPPVPITQCPTCGWTPPPPPLLCRECQRPLDLPADRAGFLKGGGWEFVAEDRWREPARAWPRRQVQVGVRRREYAGGQVEVEPLWEWVEGRRYEVQVQVGEMQTTRDGVTHSEPLMATRAVEEAEGWRETLTEEEACRRCCRRSPGPRLAAWRWGRRFSEEEVARLALDRHGNFDPVKAQALRALKQAMSVQQCGCGRWPEGFTPSAEMVVSEGVETPPAMREPPAPAEPPPLVARLFGLGKESTDVS